MIEISNDYDMYFNIGFIIFLVVQIFLGYRKGLVRSLFNLAGGVLSFFLAHRLSAVLSQYIQLFSFDEDNVVSQILRLAYQRYVNQVIWFVVLFIILKIVFFIIERMLRQIEKFPVFKQVGETFGAIIGFINGFIWIFLFCVLLNTPIFKNGNEVVRHTFVQTLVELPVMKETIAPLFNQDSFVALMEKVDTLTFEQEEALGKWLEENGYSKQDVIRESKTN